MIAFTALAPDLASATHREIACGLFGDDAIADQTGFRTTPAIGTARLVRLGFTMMRCGYRCLLPYPYRRRK